MTRFLYSGPMQSFELRVPDAEAEDGATKLQPVTCIPGELVDLPDGHPVTVALEAAGFLQPEPAETVETPAELIDVPAETPARSRTRAANQTPQE